MTTGASYDVVRSMIQGHVAVLEEFEALVITASTAPEPAA